MSVALKEEIQSLIKANRANEARKLCKTLCKKNKKDAEAWFLLGSTCAQTGELEAAIEYLRKSVSLNSRVAVTHNNLGLIYLHANRPIQAIECFGRAIKLEPDSVSTFFNLGNAFRAARQLDRAESAYRRALQLQPDLPGVLNNLGVTLLDKGESKDAERCFLRSLELAPEQNDGYVNLAKCCRDQRRVADAESALTRALKLNPHKPEIHWDLSLVLLELGRFEQGWKEYEWRLTGGGTLMRSFPIRAWQGEDLGNSSILVTAEQGIGDEIMFASCYPDLISSARHVIIDCEPRLAPLFSRSFAKAVIHTSRQTDDLSWLDRIPAPDFHVSAGSLPRHYRNRITDFPAHSGYLVADPVATEKWRSRYRELGSKRNIGISWKGGHVSQAGRRSSSLVDWESLLKLPEINFINLQYGDASADIRQAEADFGVRINHWEDSDPLSDMDDFAAQIAALDLVISVDNSTVHLAGALGKQTWIFQPYCSDWRWMEQSERSHWYPTVRQFHPDHPGNWNGMITDAAKLLAVQQSGLVQA